MKSTESGSIGTGNESTSSNATAAPGAVSLRDYFAGQAIVGFLSTYAAENTSPPATIAAKRAYEYADAMLAARSQQPQAT